MAGGTLGVVLAGGRGARLGAGVPKALVTLAGATLLERAVATVRACCDEVVVAAPRSLALPDLAPRVCDAEPGQGPLAGLLAALAGRSFTHALVLGVDLPRVTPQALRALAAHLGDAPVVLPVSGGVPQPLAAWYAAGAAAPLAAAFVAGERSLLRAVSALSPALVPAAALPGGEAAFLNVNEPADLARAERAGTAGAA